MINHGLYVLYTSGRIPCLTDDGNNIEVVNTEEMVITHLSTT